MCRQQVQSHTATSSNLDYDQPPDTWYCSECGTLNMDWYDVCPACQQGTRQSFSFSVYATNDKACLGAGEPAPGTWCCPECGASNSANTPDFCPVCDWRA